MKTNDLAVAAGDNVDPARWREAFEVLMSRIAGRFARVEPRRRVRDLVLGLLSDLARRITPERLESEGQRPDAAEILREILHREVEAADAAGASGTSNVAKSGTSQSPPMTDAARIASDRPYFDEINEQRVALAARGITDPTGAQMFGEGTDDAKTWDGIGARLEIRDRVWLIADLQRRAAARNRPASTG